MSGYAQILPLDKMQDIMDESITTEKCFIVMLTVVGTLFIATFATRFTIQFCFSKLFDNDKIDFISRRIAVIILYNIAGVSFLTVVFHLPYSFGATRSYSLMVEWIDKSGVTIESKYGYIIDWLCFGIMIDASLNALDSLAMWIGGIGFSTTVNPLIVFHHFTLLWVEITLFSCDILTDIENVWFCALVGSILAYGTVFDLLLAPSTVSILNYRFDNTKIYKALVILNIVGLFALRGVYVTALSFYFISRMWQKDWTIGVSFQIALFFLWFQWIILSRGMMNAVRYKPNVTPTDMDKQSNLLRPSDHSVKKTN